MMLRLPTCFTTKPRGSPRSCHRESDRAVKSSMESWEVLKPVPWFGSSSNFFSLWKFFFIFFFFEGNWSLNNSIASLRSLEDSIATMAIAKWLAACSTVASLWSLIDWGAALTHSHARSHTRSRAHGIVWDLMSHFQAVLNHSAMHRLCRIR